MSVERIPGEAYPSPDFEIAKGERRVKLLEGDVVIQGADPSGPILWRVGQYWALGAEQAAAHVAIGEMAYAEIADEPKAAKSGTTKPKTRRSRSRARPTKKTTPSAEEPVAAAIPTLNPEPAAVDREDPAAETDTREPWSFTTEDA